MGIRACQEGENDTAEVVIVFEPEGTSLMMGGLHPRVSAHILQRRFGTHIYGAAAWQIWSSAVGARLPRHLCCLQASLFEKPVNLEAAKTSHSEFRCREC